MAKKQKNENENQEKAKSAGIQKALETIPCSVFQIWHGGEPAKLLYEKKGFDKTELVVHFKNGLIKKVFCRDKLEYEETEE